MPKPPLSPLASRYISKHGNTRYNQRYNAGWRYSLDIGGLDQPDADGRSSDDAWMDGYMDAACEREKHHLKYCPNHDNCDGSY